MPWAKIGESMATYYRDTCNGIIRIASIYQYYHISLLGKLLPVPSWRSSRQRQKPSPSCSVKSRWWSLPFRMNSGNWLWQAYLIGYFHLRFISWPSMADMELIQDHHLCRTAELLGGWWGASSSLCYGCTEGPSPAPETLRQQMGTTSYYQVYTDLQLLGAWVEEGVHRPSVHTPDYW